MFVSETCECLNLLRLIDRAHLGALRNRDDAGLRVVLIANAMVGVADGRQRDLAILMGQWNQLAAGVLLRRTAFVAVDVGIVATQDRLKRPGQGLETENIRSGAVESEENCDIGSKMFLKPLDCGAGVRVVSVGDYVALVGTGDGFENFGMDTGIVVAGKAAGGLGEDRRHTA
jgi:hypothetical protein